MGNCFGMEPSIPPESKVFIFSGKYSPRIVLVERQSNLKIYFRHKNKIIGIPKSCVIEGSEKELQEFRRRWSTELSFQKSF